VRRQIPEAPRGMRSLTLSVCRRLARTLARTPTVGWRSGRRGAEAGVLKAGPPASAYRATDEIDDAPRQAPLRKHMSAGAPRIAQNYSNAGDYAGGGGGGSGVATDPSGLAPASDRRTSGSSGAPIDDQRERSLGTDRRSSRLRMRKGSRGNRDPSVAQGPGDALRSARTAALTTAFVFFRFEIWLSLWRPDDRARRPMPDEWFNTHSAVSPRAADDCIARMMRKPNGARLTSDPALLTSDPALLPCVCPRTPRLTSALGPGWLRAGDRCSSVPCDGCSPRASTTRTYGLWPPSRATPRLIPTASHRTAGGLRRRPTVFYALRRRGVREHDGPASQRK
jgi:hypothetical protein